MIKEIINSNLSFERTPKEHKDRFYPSQASSFITFQKYKKLYGTCIRAAYYSCIGIKEDKNEYQENNFQFLKKEIGKYTETMILNILNKSGNIKKKKISFLNEKYNISGELDAIITIDNEDYGLEIKSISGDNYYINSLIFTNSCPKWQDLFQTVIYCYVFREQLPNGFILFYIRRDTCQTKEFRIQIEPTKNGNINIVINGKVEKRLLVNDILDRFVILKKYIDSCIVPPRDYSEIYSKEDALKYYSAGIISKKQLDSYYIKPFGDQACAYCAYKQTCKEQENK